MRNDPGNHLHYGDNLTVLRRDIADASVDLIYLDPPFNSNANYNILFRSPTGTSADAQIEAFEDTWHWNDSAEDAFDQVARSGHTHAFDLLRAMRGFLGQNDMMAYLVMMAVRLIELHRVLKPTGSLYLHCDPTASHYLKLLLDGVFGPERFVNELVWKRTFAHKPTHKFGPVHDVVLFCCKSTQWTWNAPTTDHEQVYLARFRNRDHARGESYQDISLTGPGITAGESGAEWRGFVPGSIGRHWAIPRAVLQREGIEALGTLEALDKLAAVDRIHWSSREGGLPRLKWFASDMSGASVADVWTDIAPVNAQAQERLGYPTQKPLALLERIIAASSNEGDVVLDPFCGCGTAIHAAQKLGRRWIGIDVTHLAIALIEKRMRDAFPGVGFTVEGTPKDLASAEDLALRDKYQFQWWAVSMVGALPFGGRKKGADGGIDGLIYFDDLDPVTETMRKQRAIVSVKGGLKPSVAMVETLAATIEREGAPIGVLLMNALPTREMERRAAAVGVYRDGIDESFPRLQIITLAELFQGKRPRIPNIDRTALRRAKAEDGGRQRTLL